MPKTKVGIIGGSGLGDALCGETKGGRVCVDTPFGKPSSEIIEITPNNSINVNPHFLFLK